jgi:uncharacterized membrane protein
VAKISLPKAIFFVASVGMLFSFYLVFLQVVLVKALCFWCMISAFFELGIWVSAMVDWRRHRAFVHSIS